MDVRGTKIYIETYGCQMNKADSEDVARNLTRSGMTLCFKPAEADVILVNTCSVRQRAEQRVIGRIQQLGTLKSYRPELLVGVIGCMAERLGEQTGQLTKAFSNRIPSLDILSRFGVWMVVSP